jgi:hypothetical protein
MPPFTDSRYPGQGQCQNNGPMMRCQQSQHHILGMSLSHGVYSLQSKCSHEPNINIWRLGCIRGEGFLGLLLKNGMELRQVTCPVRYKGPSKYTKKFLQSAALKRLYVADESRQQIKQPVVTFLGYKNKKKQGL